MIKLKYKQILPDGIVTCTQTLIGEKHNAVMIMGDEEYDITSLEIQYPLSNPVKSYAWTYLDKKVIIPTNIKWLTDGCTCIKKDYLCQHNAIIAEIYQKADHFFGKTLDFHSDALSTVEDARQSVYTYFATQGQYDFVQYEIGDMDYIYIVSINKKSMLCDAWKFTELCQIEKFIRKNIDHKYLKLYGIRYGQEPLDLEYELA